MYEDKIQIVKENEPLIPSSSQGQVNHQEHDDEKREAPKANSLTIDSHIQEEKEVQNMNVRAAIIHILGDMIQSAGVVTAAIIIYVKPEWKIADPITTFIFTILVICTTLPIFMDCIVVLMEATPSEINIVDCFKDCL